MRKHEPDSLPRCGPGQGHRRGAALLRGILGCTEGRSAPEWVDFNLYGHQFVCHLNPALGPKGRLSSHFNPVDGHGVPVPHCGVVLEPQAWRELVERLQQHPIEWVIEPTTRFPNTPGEQSTLFILDPTGMRPSSSHSVTSRPSFSQGDRRRA